MSTELRHQLVALLPKLRAFALSLTRSRPEADDLVQAACEKALRSLGTYRSGTNFEAWSMRIVYTQWVDGHRRRAREGVLESTDAMPDRAGDDGRETVEARSALSSAWTAIADLPEGQRSVLVLVCVEGLGYRETAEVLDIPVGTVMSRLSRARQTLADALDPTGAQISPVPASGRSGGS